MSLHGHVFRITDVLAAFTPVIADDENPTTGFTPWVSATVSADYIMKKTYNPPRPKKPGIKPPLGQTVTTHWGISTKTAKDGSFKLAEPPKSVEEKHGNASLVMLRVSNGVTIYRTSYMAVKEAQSRALDIWVFIATDAQQQGINAGFISQQLNTVSAGGVGLPSDTLISAGGADAPFGINFVGSSNEVRLIFNVWIAPATGSDIQDYFNLTVNGWDINVYFPDTLFITAGEIADALVRGIPAADGSVSAGVVNTLAADLVAQGEGLITLDQAKTFFNNEVTVTFANITYPEELHSWGLSDTNDTTIIIRATPAIGFPQL
jgi:hypothetical protein